MGTHSVEFYMSRGFSRPMAEYFNNFRRVYLDEQGCISWDIDPAVDSNVVWNNKVDLDPDVCYVDSNPI